MKSTRFENVENEHLDFLSQQLENKVRINVGFINRPNLDSIYPQIDDAAEDVERSARSRRAARWRGPGGAEILLGKAQRGGGCGKF